MKPFTKLAEARTAAGSTLTLHSRDGHHYLRVNGQPLMSTDSALSEAALAELGCDRLRGRKEARVLVGGLGFGFTLRRVLGLVGADAVVEVAELSPEVVAWNREFLPHVNGRCLDDPRVLVSIRDVCQIIAQAPAGHYDAILLDVDNGPVAVVQEGNARLYQPRGLESIARALKPTGRVAFWSAGADKPFVRRLAAAGFTVQTVPVKSHAHARREDNNVFVGDRKV